MDDDKKDNYEIRLEESREYHSTRSEKIREDIDDLLDGSCFQDWPEIDLNFVHTMTWDLSDVLVDFLRNTTEISDMLFKQVSQNIDYADDQAYLKVKNKFKKAMGVIFQIQGQLLIDDGSMETQQVLGQRFEKEFKIVDGCFEKLFALWESEIKKLP